MKLGIQYIFYRNNFIFRFSRVQSDWLFHKYRNRYDLRRFLWYKSYCGLHNSWSRSRCRSQLFWSTWNREALPSRIRATIYICIFFYCSFNGIVFIQLQDLLGTRVSQVACGRCHTLALTEHGHVYSFGLNSSGQAGVPTAPNYVISPKRLDIPAAVSKIVASWDQSVAICDRRNEVRLQGDGMR